MVRPDVTSAKWRPPRHATRRALLFFTAGLLSALPGRSMALSFSVGGTGYNASIEFQTPCCAILTDNLVTNSSGVSAYMHSTTPDQSAFSGFTMTSSLLGELKIDGRSIGTTFANGFYAGFPGLSLNDTLTPTGPTVGGSYLITPHLRLTGEIILDHTFDTTDPPPNGLMQFNYFVRVIGFDGASGVNSCGGTGDTMVLPVDAPFDFTVGGSSACEVGPGGHLEYTVKLGEYGSGQSHGQITNAEVHVGNTITPYFDLPEGVSLTSASGAFQNVNPAPEPTISALLLVSFGVIGFAARRNLGRRQA